MSLFPRKPSGKAVSVFFIRDGAQGESPWSCGGVMGGVWVQGMKSTVAKVP